jgi:hypothetical protein
MTSTVTLLIAIIPYLAITAFSIWKNYSLSKELQLYKTELFQHRAEIIRLGEWSKSAATTIYEITQHLKYIVDMDKAKKEFPLLGPKGNA